MLALFMASVTTTSYAQWIVPDSSHMFTSLSTDGTNLYAASIDGNEPNVYKSTNQGNNWSIVYPNNYFYDVTMCYQGKVYIAAHRNGSGMRKSTNGGLNWIPINISGGDSVQVFNMYGHNNQIFAGCGGGLWRSPNAGYDWFKMLSTNGNPTAIGSIGSRLLYAFGSKLYRTTNAGYTWDSITQPIGFNCFNTMGNTVYAGGGSINNLGIWKSTDEGVTWVRVGASTLPNGSYRSIINSGGMLITGLAYIYVSTDNGNNWVKSNSEFTNGYAFSDFTIENENIYTLNPRVYRNTLNNVIGLEQLSTVTPKNYQLSQNYPNPFNPSTTIRFDVTKVQLIRLSVFDVLGKEIVVLVDEQLRSGTYAIDWNASGVATGVYFYTLSAEGYTETKKMMLLK